VKTKTVFLIAVVVSACEGQVSGNDGSETLLTYDQFLSSAFQDEEGQFVVDGDMSFSNEGELRAFYEVYRADFLNRTQDTAVTAQKLAVAQSNGADVILGPNRRKNITYCINKTRLGVNYQRVVNQMNNATADWEATGADINFVHLADLDPTCNKDTTGVFFNVSGAPPQATYLAAAFFPNYERQYRVIKIHDRSYTSVAPLRGILRHELGHALGFVHEHVRPESNSFCIETGSFRPLTNYDRASVMHYPQCNGTGVFSFNLTDRDREGVRRVYPR
jgi:serralysin